VGKMKILFFI